MSRLRVMIVISRMNIGGPAVLISEQMRGLDEEVFEQFLVTGYCDTGEEDYLEKVALDIPAIRVKGLGRAIRLRDDFMALLELTRLIRELEPDIIHTHAAKAGALGRIASIFARSQARLIHTYHGHLLHGYFTPRKTAVFTRIERFLGKRTDNLVAVGEQVKEDLLGARIGTPGQFIVIRPGVRVPPFPSRREARERLGLSEEPVIVAMLGRLTRIKRPDRFAQVVSRVAGVHPDVHFIVAGSGDLEIELEEVAQRERLPITFLGWREDYESVLAACDVLLLTSDNEGTPLSLVQAGLARRPVVATDVGSVREIVIDGVTGLLEQPTDEDLARGVLSLVADPHRRHILGDRAQAHCERYFSVDEYLNQHVLLYSAGNSTHE